MAIVCLSKSLHDIVQWFIKQDRPHAPGYSVNVALKHTVDLQSSFVMNYYNLFSLLAGSAMDIVLRYADDHVFTPYVYPSSWPEGGALRQIISLLIVTNLGATAIYLFFGMLSYYLIFDHTLKKHPQYLPVSLTEWVLLWMFHRIFSMEICDNLF